MDWLEQGKAQVGRLGIGLWLSYPRRARAARRGAVSLSVGGVTIDVPVRSAAEVTRVDRIRHEDEFVSRLLGAVRPGDVVFDVGANMGVVTSLLGRRIGGDGGRVFGFEPHPELVLRAREVVGQVAVESAQVVDVAVGAENGEAQLMVDASPLSGRHSLAGAEASGRVVRVAAQTLTAAAEVLGVRPSVVKVDVEGGELDVLRGAAELLASGAVRAWFIEWHTRTLSGRGESMEAGVRLLEGYGYRSVWRHARGFECHEQFVRDDGA